jgi:hypothetical protein
MTSKAGDADAHRESAYAKLAEYSVRLAEITDYVIDKGDAANIRAWHETLEALLADIECYE